jgi:hypothetical protein
MLSLLSMQRHKSCGLRIWYQNQGKERLVVLRFLVYASFECAWNSLRNCVRIVIGLKPRFDERGLFLRQYLLHLSGIRPIRKITCTGLENEGAGSQALMIMKAIHFARSSGLTYVHTPFTRISHAERPMPEWVAAWESLFNLGAGETARDLEKREVVNYCYNVVGLELCFGWRNRRQELVDRFKAIVPEFKRKYYLNTSPRTTDEVTVAVHVRRGDVSADHLGHYFTDTDVILRTTAAVKSILDACNIRKYRIGIYSNGTRDELAEFSLLGAELYINVDAIRTMRELIEADILIMGKGCFSGYAALISDGIRIFEPKLTWGALTGYWFVPGQVDPSVADHWLPCLADGSFDGAAFKHQLLQLIHFKAMAGTKASTAGSDRESHDRAARV